MVNVERIAVVILNGKCDYGFNARTEKYENLYESGVIDTTKVARIAGAAHFVSRPFLLFP